MFTDQLTADEVNAESLPVCRALEKSLSEEPHRWIRKSTTKIVRDDGLWIKYTPKGPESGIFLVGHSTQDWAAVRFHDIAEQKISSSLYVTGRVVRLAKKIWGHGDRKDLLAEIHKKLGL